MVRKLFLKMTVPQIIAALSSSVCLLVDSIIIGRLLGIDAMSAYGLASPIVIIFSSTVLMLVCGTQVISASELGKGDLKRLSGCYSTSLVACIATALIIMSVVLLLTDPICVILGSSKSGVNENVSEMTKEYLRGYFLGTPFFFLGQIAIPYLQAMGKRGILLRNVVSMTIADVVFNLLSVYVFHAGIFGIGLASGLSYLVGFLASVRYFVKKDCIFKFNIKNISRTMLADIIKAGSPIILVELCYIIRVYLFNQMFLWLGGTDAVAVFSIVNSIGDILFSIALGTSGVTLTLSSIFYGEEDRRSLAELVRSMTLCTFVIITLAVALTCVIAPLIAVIYLGGYSGVYDNTVTGIRLFALSLIPVCINLVFARYYQGINKIKLTNLILVIEGLALPTFFAWIMGMQLGINGIWIGTNIGQAVVLLVISVLVWHRAGKISFTAESYGYLDAPDSWPTSDNTMDVTVKDKGNAVQASEAFYGFYNEKGIGKRKALILSMCVEEIAMNIIQHGFSADKRKHTLEIRTVCKKEECLLHFRDDCASFDPIKYIELHNNECQPDHIGLHMIMNMVDDATYLNSLGLNNLILKVKV